MRSIFSGLLLVVSVIFGGSYNLVLAEEIKVTKPERVGMSGDRLLHIGSAMRKLIDEKKIPGTVSLVARKGKVVHFEANGLRDVERGLPMQKDTIFRLYSQSKPVTGVAVMILFEEGRFLLTDPVSKYLPEFSDMRVYIGEEDGVVKTEPAAPITIQQLLTHTSGLTYDFLPSPVAKMYYENGVVGGAHQIGSLQEGMKSGQVLTLKSLAEWSELVATMPLVAQPGTQWNYSVGMDVLGRLVEVVSGKSYGEFLQERLFDPLGMVDTGFYVPKEKLDRFAANYMPSAEGKMQLFDDPQNSPYAVPPNLEMGGSGLVGTVGDYLKFAQMLVNKGEYEGSRILGRKTVEFMVSNHLTPGFSDDPLSSLYGSVVGGRAWGIGAAVTGLVVTNPATYGLPVSAGLYSWGGAASTDFWIDHEEELVGIIHTQLLPSGTYPTAQLMQLTTYQAITD